MSADDLRLCAKRISMDLHEPDSGEMTTQIRLAIIDSIKLLQDEHLPFNHGDCEFSTVTGKYIYGPDSLPQDFLRPLDGDVICFQNENPAQGYHLRKIGRNEARRLLVAAQQSNAQPVAWSWVAGAVWILPPPDATINTIRIRYRKEIAAPKVDYDGTTVTFGDAESFSPWFTIAERAVRLRAEYLLCRDYLLDTDRAQSILSGYLEELASLQGLTVSEMGAEIPGDL